MVACQQLHAGKLSERTPARAAAKAAGGAGGGQVQAKAARLDPESYLGTCPPPPLKVLRFPHGSLARVCPHLRCRVVRLRHFFSSFWLGFAYSQHAWMHGPHVSLM